jgi:cell division protein FtsI (penicillin-binding protein 3)
VVLMILSLIAGRLLQLQGLDRSAYAASAQNQQHQTITLTATRGTITDRDGHPFATTVDARNVVADPEQMSDPTLAAATLAPILGLNATALAQRLEVHTQYALLTPTPVTPAVGDRILALNVPGITTPDTSQRIYPDGTLASNVIGFVNASGQGAGGLELSYQKTLAGHNGTNTYQVGANGAQIPDGRGSLDPAVPGTSLRLSIQRDIQYEAQQAIAKQVKATGALSGTVIVMDPRNGQLLALAAAPGFNPNDVASANPANLGDPAVGDVYEPGSVNKVITMSAGLQDKVVTPTSRFIIPNSLSIAGTPFHDAESHGTEKLTLTGILAKSSNIGAIKVAERLGAQRLDHYLLAYGFGRPTGVGLPGESGGLLPGLSAWSGTTLPTVSFGQGIGVTAIQVASVYSTIANGGVRVQPNVVEDTIDQHHNVTPAPAPRRNRVISAKTAAELRNMMEAVTSNEGTAPAARIKGYRVAGKTGTASRPNGHGGYSGYTASFAGFAPADKPRLVVEVVLQKPIRGYYGGAVAAPVFHDVMSFALQSLGIAPTFTKPPTAKLTW